MERIRRLGWHLIAAAFLAGIGMGLVLGWQVWPVQWYNTDPSDLRMKHQMGYVLMTADSLAVTGDVQMAQRRLLELTDKDTTWPQVADLVYRVAEEQEEAGHGAAALRVRRLAEVLGMPSVEREPFESPKKRIASPPRWFLMSLGIIAFVSALGIVGWLVACEFRERGPAQEGTLTFGGAGEGPGTPERPEMSAVLPPWEDEEVAQQTRMEEPQGTEGEVMEAAPFEEAPLPPAEEGETVALREDDWMAQAMPTTPEESPPVEVPPGALDVFETTYTYGDDDFDRSFSIESQEGEFLGECGVSVSDIVEISDTLYDHTVIDTQSIKSDAQRVDAFEVWLFDKGDIRTVAKVLVSKYAYEDESLREELGANGDLVPAERALTFSLDTLSLQVKVTVEDVDYLPDEDMPEGIFSRLSLRMVVAEGE